MKSSLKVKDKEILEKSENEEVAKEKTVKLYVRSLEDKPMKRKKEDYKIN